MHDLKTKSDVTTGSGTVLPPVTGDDLLDPLLLDTPKDPAEVGQKVDKLLSRRLFDLTVTDEDATGALDELLSLPDDQMAQVLSELDGKGKVMRLFKQLPDAVYTSRTEDTLRLYRNAPRAVLVARMEDLLKYKLFDWAITKGDTDIVLDILSVLPQADRDAFIYKDGGRWYDTLMDAHTKNAPAVDEVSKEVEKTEDEITKTEQLVQGDVKSDPVLTDTELVPKTIAEIPTTAPTEENKQDKPGFFKRVGAGARVVKGLFDGKVDLDDAQTLAGGSLGGVDLDEEAGNELLLDAQWSKGLFEAQLPSLGIESVSMDGVTTGAGTLKGLYLGAKWSTEEDPASYLKFDISSFDLSNITVVIGSDTYTVGNVSISDVHLWGTDSPVTQSKPMKKGEALTLVKNQILSAFKVNLPAFKMILGGDYEKPETLGDRVLSQFGADLDVCFDIGKLTLGDVKKNGALMLDTIQVDGFGLELHDVSVKDRLQEELAGLEGVGSPTAEQQARIEELKGQLAVWTEKEARLQVLEGKHATASLDMKEQDELISLRNELKVAAATVTIGSITGSKADYGGQGAESIDVRELAVTVSGGELEALRRHKTRSETLDDVIGSRHPDAQLIEDKALPEQKVTGSAKSVDLQGVRYDYDTEDNKAYDTKLSMTATDMAFGMQGDDFSLSSKTFGVSGLDFEPYGVKLGELSGTDLSMKTDLSTYATELDAKNLAGKDVDLTRDYDTRLDEVSSDHLHVSVDEQFSTRVTGQNVNTRGIHYDEGGELETHVGSTHMDELSAGYLVTGPDVDDTYTYASGKGLVMSDVSYVPSDVTVDKGTAEEFSFEMFDENEDPEVTSTHMGVTAKGMNLEGFGYGKEGTDSRTTVDKIGSDAIAVDMSGDGSILATSDQVDLSGIQVGQVDQGKGTTVQSTTLGGLSAGMGADGGVFVDAKETTVGGIQHLDSGTSVNKVAMKDLDFDMPAGDGAPMTVTSSSGQVSGVSSHGVTVDKVGYTDLGMSYGDDGLALGLGTYDVRGVGYASTSTSEEKGLTTTTTDRAHVHSVRGKGLDFGMSTAGDMTFGTDEATLGGVSYVTKSTREDGKTSRMGVTTTGGQLTDFKGSYSSEGVIGADLSSMHLGTTKVTSTSYDPTLEKDKSSSSVTSLRTLDVTDLHAQDLTTGGPGVGPSGDLSIGHFGGTGVVSTNDGDVTKVEDFGVDGTVVQMSPDGTLLAKSDKITATDVSHTGDGYSGSVGSTTVTDGRVALSGLGGDKVKLDGAGASDVSMTDLQGDVDVWKMVRGDGTTTTRVGDEGDGRTVTPEEQGKFSADALAGASGTFHAKVPIKIDLGWAGAYKADATLKITARDGKVKLDDIQVDLDWIQDVAAVAGAMGNAALTTLTSLSLDDFGLYIDGSGRLQLYITASGLYGAVGYRWDIELFDGKDFGFEGKDDAAEVEILGFGDNKVEDTGAIRLEGLVEGLMNSEKETETKETGTGKAPDLDGAVGEINPYVWIGKVEVGLSGLKLSDGRIGTDKMGLTLVDSDEVNDLDFHLVTGEGGTLHSDGVHATDVTAGDLRIKRVEVDEVDGTVTPLVETKGKEGTLAKKTNATATVGSVSASELSYGSTDVLTDTRFDALKPVTKKR